MVNKAYLRGQNKVMSKYKVIYMDVEALGMVDMTNGSVVSLKPDGDIIKAIMNANPVCVLLVCNTPVKDTEELDTLMAMSVDAVKRRCKVACFGCYAIDNVDENKSLPNPFIKETFEKGIVNAGVKIEEQDNVVVGGDLFKEFAENCGIENYMTVEQFKSKDYEVQEEVNG